MADELADKLSDYHLERLGSHNGIAMLNLKCGSTTVGRVSTNNMVCNSPFVSRKHCVITVTEENEVIVKIENTVNGIYINGHQTLVANAEVLVKTNDIIGIGCDTSNDEISNENCFIFQLKRKPCDIISLSDSEEEEEEEKVQELYSQLNLVEMKQEMMDLEDFVEEYSRIKNESDSDVDLEPNNIKDEVMVVEDEEMVVEDEEIVVKNAEMVVEDVFENIISNSDKSYAEKSELVNGMVPDVATLLKKDCVTIDNEEIVSPRTESSCEIEETSKELIKNVPVIKTRRVTVSLPYINTTSALLSLQKTNLLKQENNLVQIQSARRLTSDELSKNSTQSIETTKKLNVQVSAKILNRRHSCYVPSSNHSITKCSPKRKVEIIDAPHMPKRRKSISGMPESSKRPPKVMDFGKWMAKKPKIHLSKRTKEHKDEIKSKLAALANETKEKVVEVKIVRSNTKIPVKNTQKTRSDYLTDTIVKPMPSTSRSKNKKTDTVAHLPKISKIRITENKIAEINPDSVGSPKVRIIENKIAEINPDSAGSPKISFQESASSSKISKSVLIPEEKVTDAGSDETSNYDLNRNSNKISYTSTTTTVVKSILKKPNQIQKRRITVTFADNFRPKIDAPKIDTRETAKKFGSPNIDTRETAKKFGSPNIDNRETDEVDSFDVIYNIMSLGVSTLKQSSNSPPINGKNFNYQTVTHQYESLKHLQNVFIPLMKAELWKEIEDGYSRTQKQQAIHVQLNYFEPDEDHKNRFMYHCQTQSSTAVHFGALIIVSNIKSRKDFFGYIVKRQMTNQTCFFDFITPVAIQESAYDRALLTMKQIMYIRPNLKVFDALFKLKSSPLLKYILQPAHNCVEHQVKPFDYIGFNTLNEDQMTTLSKVYLQFISAQPFISLIEGPPGTGKSRLITNLIVQLLYGNEIQQLPKILVCAPSNAAVDIITKNLLQARKRYEITSKNNRKKLKIVRFGVLEKMDRSVRSASLQELIKLNEKNVLIQQEKLMDCKKKKQTELDFYLSGLKICHTREGMLKVDLLRKEISNIEANIKKVSYNEHVILENAHIICTTLNSCCALSEKISSMDICIIDEATQCNEPTSLIPLQFGVRSLVLVGDTKQLASTVVSKIAKQYNYDQSLFQRLQKSFEVQCKNPILQLSIQYRMHPDILHWPNEFFYKNRLVSAESTKNQTSHLKPYIVFNLNFEQSTQSEHKHISNVDEANFVRHLLDFLITKADPKIYSYGIISAYSQQKDDLAKNLGLTYPFVSVNTIDSCQGQERDIIIISIARSRGIGFLAIRQRLNVALTRAKKMLILCGNFNSLQSHSMWNKLLDDAKQRNFYLHFPKMDDSLYESYFEKYLIS